MAKISALCVYPIKSCAGITVKKTILTEFGLENDRRFMLVDKDGKFISQRTLPNMCLIETCIDGNKLFFNAPNMKTMDVLLGGLPGRDKKVDVWGDNCIGIDQGDVYADWFSNFLNFSCRFVAYPTANYRRRHSSYLKKDFLVSFADGYPILIISKESLVDLNSRMKEPLSMNRFRPNIIVSECRPYEEDEWQDIRIGNVRLRGTTQCLRCSITTVNQDTAERGKDPLKTLAIYRKSEKGVFFGRNFIVDNAGELSVGEKIGY